MSRGRRKKTLYTTRNNAKLLSSGKEYFDCLEALINGAKEAIHLQTYIYDEDETGNRIAEALMAAAERGVTVCVLLDGYASQGLSREFVDRLKTAGILINFFEPLFRSKSFYFGRRLHYKVLVADGSACLVAGRNISNRYNDLPGQPAWLDWAVHAEGEVAGELQRECIRRWNNNCPKNERIYPAQAEPYLAAEGCRIRVRINDWVNKKTEVLQSYMQMFGSAEQEIIVMTSYFWPGRKLVKKIHEAAARGVKIKLVLASISDIKLAKYSERFMYSWLFARNIEIYEYNKHVLHGKMAVCDKKWVTIGSFNVSNISTYASIELNLDIMDNALAQTAYSKLSGIIANDCTLITPEAYSKEYNIVNRFFNLCSFVILNIIFFVFTFYFRQKRAKA